MTSTHTPAVYRIPIAYRSQVFSEFGPAHRELRKLAPDCFQGHWVQSVAHFNALTRLESIAIERLQFLEFEARGLISSVIIPSRIALPQSVRAGATLESRIIDAEMLAQRDMDLNNLTNALGPSLEDLLKKDPRVEAAWETRGKRERAETGAKLVGCLWFLRRVHEQLSKLLYQLGQYLARAAHIPIAAVWENCDPEDNPMIVTGPCPPTPTLILTYRKTGGRGPERDLVPTLRDSLGFCIGPVVGQPLLDRFIANVSTNTPPEKRPLIGVRSSVPLGIAMSLWIYAHMNPAFPDGFNRRFREDIKTAKGYLVPAWDPNSFKEDSTEVRVVGYQPVLSP